jgi:phosphoribosyl-ATP pyrophosphohydrolase/phosphoribosyl-AMP cyclohydrolase
MNIDFEKYADGLVPAIVQDARDGKVLMLGFMNADALKATIETNRVTFYSRSKQRLWTKGETSANFLTLRSVRTDCDNDSLLITANPTGPVCHTGSTTCFADNTGFGFFGELENVIEKRKSEAGEDSYVASLFAKGINKIAQKVGEEAVETVIAAKDDDAQAFVSEATDLLFHYLVLLNAKGVSLAEISAELEGRHRG